MHGQINGCAIVIERDGNQDWCVELEKAFLCEPSTSHVHYQRSESQDSHDARVAQVDMALTKHQVCVLRIEDVEVRSGRGGEVHGCQIDDCEVCDGQFYLTSTRVQLQRASGFYS